MPEEDPWQQRMYANTVRIHYKSSQDAEQAIERIRDVVTPVARLPGFIDLTLVRTGDAETLSVVRFDTKKNADAAREGMLPRVREAVQPFVIGEPEVRPGEVPLEIHPEAKGQRASAPSR